MRSFVLSGLLTVATPVFSCTCVSAVGSNAKTMLSYYDIVFRGTVIDRKVLPQRVEMKGRRRYAITFRVEKYWKGAPDLIRILYGVDDGSDCLGGSDFETGKNYLVYDTEQAVKDEIIDNQFFWYGWTDILPEGSGMLVPSPCTPSGETKSVPTRKALRQLGKGRALANNWSWSR